MYQKSKMRKCIFLHASSPFCLISRCNSLLKLVTKLLYYKGTHLLKGEICVAQHISKQ